MRRTIARCILRDRSGCATLIEVHVGRLVSHPQDPVTVSAKWRLWHYQPVSCFSKLSYLSDQLDALSDGDAKTRTTKLLLDLKHYLYRNERFLGDYANRHRGGLPVSSGTAESTVNCVISKRFVKKQPMSWSPAGANALLQIRCAVLNGRYWQQFQKRDSQADAANESTMPLAA